MGSLMRQFDWSGSILGPPRHWPHALKSATATLLASPFPMHITWGKACIQLYNDAYKPILDTGEDNIALGNPIWDSHPELWVSIKALFDRVLRGQSIRNTDLEFKVDNNGTGGHSFYDSSYSPIINEVGQICGVLTNLIDISPRKKAEAINYKLSEELKAVNEELNASNEELTRANDVLLESQLVLQETLSQLQESDTSLRLAIDAADFGIWHIHSATREFVTSPRFRELFGLSHFEKITIEQAISQIRVDFREQVTDALENAIYHNGEYDITYPVIIQNDKGVKWLRAIGKLRPFQPGGYSDFTGVVMDISDIKNEEQRKNDFISMVSHELKTPLTSISAYLQFLQHKTTLEVHAPLSRPIEHALLQVKKMTGMISGFLDLAYLESAQIKLDLETFDIAALIGELRQEYSELYSSHILSYINVHNIRVVADRAKISQVINNFASNAVKYAPPGSRIEFSSKVEGTNAVLMVRDNGIGIPASEKPKIFDRYYRGENNGTISGFGLGLYLSAEIVRRHGGRIWVESEPGTGSSFFFTLPIGTLEY